MSKLLSVIVPAYNEGQNICRVLEKVLAVNLVYGIEKEILVVDDGSKDDTYGQAEAFIKAHPQAPVRLFRHEQNAGKGMAIRTALPHTKGDFIIIQDGDLELDPNDFSALLKCMIDGNHTVVYGSRFLNKQNTVLYRRFYWGGRLVSFITNLLYGQHITDEPTCYKLFRAELLKSIPLNCTGFEFCPEVTAKVAKRGIRIQEVPISYTPRTLEQGKKLRWTDGLEAVGTLLKYRFRD